MKAGALSFMSKCLYSPGSVVQNCVRYKVGALPAVAGLICRLGKRVMAWGMLPNEL